MIKQEIMIYIPQEMQGTYLRLVPKCGIVNGSVALLSHFAKCKNRKCENKKCETISMAKNA